MAVKSERSELARSPPEKKSSQLGETEAERPRQGVVLILQNPAGGHRNVTRKQRTWLGGVKKIGKGGER